ncbi:MAG: Cupin region [Geminicoccaceae bacterium]|nr:Cupin region [Geminicoccaceae bacterium]
MFTRFLCGVAFAALSVSAASADDLSTVLITTDKSKVTLVFDRALPNVPGKSMKGVLVEYQPGGSNPAHTHPDVSRRRELGRGTWRSSCRQRK